jgi:hypothetical protein
MELLERYLYAVKCGLPRAQQDDIIAELGEDLRSQIEDKEAALGRLLDDSEIATILKQRGHPTSVASGYLPQQYLIGPALFPVYRLVLQIVVVWVLVPVFVLIVGPIAVVAAAHPSAELVKTLWDLAMSAVFTLGVVTLVFAVVERHPAGCKEFEKWEPRRLPRVPKVEPDPRPTPRVTAIAELAAGLVVSWLFVTWFRTTFDFPGVRVTLTPVWRNLYWPFLLVLLGGVPVGWVSLIWPSRTRLRSSIRLTIHGLSLVVVSILLRAQTWVEIAAPQLPAAGIEEAVKWTNFGIGITLCITAIITVAEAIREARRILKKRAVRPSIASRIVGNRKRHGTT